MPDVSKSNIGPSVTTVYALSKLVVCDDCDGATPVSGAACTWVQTVLGVACPASKETNKKCNSRRFIETCFQATGVWTLGQTINSAYTTAPGSNIIQPALLQTSSAKVATALAQLVPSSGNYDICGDYTYKALPLVDIENQLVGRVDWERTQNDTIFGRYFITKYTQPSYYTVGNLFSSSATGLSDQIQTVAIGDTRVIGAHIINTVRLAFDRTATQRTSNPGIPTICQLGAAATCPIANFINVYYKNTPGFLGYDFENSYGFSEGFAWTNGKHQVNAGFTWLHVQMNGNGTFQMNPTPTLLWLTS